MTEAYSSYGLTRGRYNRSFVCIQLVFRFLLIIAKVEFALAMFSSKCFDQLRFDCKTTPRYLQWSTWLEVYYLNFNVMYAYNICSDT